MSAFRVLAWGMALAALALAPARGESVKIGLVKSSIAAPLYVAVDKGFFAAQGIEPELVYFDAGQPVAVAVVSGGIEFGVTGFTGGFFSLAAQDSLRMIAAHSREVPGFHGLTFFVSNRAAAAGLTAFADLPDHSVAVNTVGSAFHYAIGLIAEKYRFDLKRVRVLALQTNSNEVSALSGGTVDAVVMPNSYGAPLVERGGAKRLGWAGDETPWQLGAAFVSTRTADTKSDLIKRFLAAYRQGARYYHDAVTGPDERPREGSAMPEVVAIIAKYLGQTPAEIRGSIAYADADERLDVNDILHQIQWYKAQGMLKGDIPDAVIDKRYIIPLPAQ